MNRLRVISCFALLIGIVVTAAAPNRSRVMAAGQSSIPGYGNLPLSFESNQGQFDPEVKFIARGNGYTLFLTSTEAVLSLRKGAPKSGKRSLNPTDRTPTLAKSAVLQMAVLNASDKASISGLDELPGKANYFIGSDPAKWQTNIATFDKVRFQGIYSGVDLVYYGNQQQLEYDFVVSAGADPNAIAIRFDGSPVEIDSAGGLVVHTDGDEVHFLRPVAYQSVAGKKHFIDSRFSLRGSNQIAFKVAAYDHSQPLVIDPVLVYSTFLGGSFPDESFSIAVDSSGAAYVTGITCSADFPVTTGAFQKSHKGADGACPTSQNSFEDAFVTKFNSTGTALVYSTYIGGSASDRGYDIAVDSSGNAYIAGQTQSSDYPVTSGAFETSCPGGVNGCNTGVVTKLNATGSHLVYSTYLGGNNNMGATGIAVNSSGEAYVTGATDGTYPTTVGAYQTSNPRNGAGLSPVFAALNTTGSACVYCTFLGGAQGHSYNPGSQAFGVAIDSKGMAYITGWTDSPDFPTTAGAFQTQCGTDGNCNGLWDAFVAKLDPTKSGAASLVYSTFLGGNGTDLGFGITVDSSGNAYVTGTTGANANTQFGGSLLPSSDFPTTAGAFQTACPGSCTLDSAWVTKLNASGSALVYSTYMGGANGNTESGSFGTIVVDSALNAYVTGTTSATDFPTQKPVQASNAGTADAYVTELNPNGSALIFSTYLGGSSSDAAISIALDKSANMYVTGLTSSANFPHTAGAFRTVCPGSCTYYHAFVAKIGRYTTATSLASSPNPSVFGQSVTLTAGVTSSAGVPSGTVSFMKGKTVLGTGTLSAGTAKFSTSKLPVATNSINAVYGGSSKFLNSTSNTVKQVVGKATTKTKLVSSANPSNLGQSVTFTATVTPEFSGTPSGAVTFVDGTTTLKTVTMSGGTAKFTTSALASGTHNIKATYNGNIDFTTSSASLTQTVN